MHKHRGRSHLTSSEIAEVNALSDTARKAYSEEFSNAFNKYHDIRRGERLADEHWRGKDPEELGQLSKEGQESYEERREQHAAVEAIQRNWRGNRGRRTADIRRGESLAAEHWGEEHPDEYDRLSPAGKRAYDAMNDKMLERSARWKKNAAQSRLESRQGRVHGQSMLLHTNPLYKHSPTSSDSSARTKDDDLSYRGETPTVGDNPALVYHPGSRTLPMLATQTLSPYTSPAPSPRTGGDTTDRGFFSEPEDRSGTDSPRAGAGSGTGGRYPTHGTDISGGELMAGWTESRQDEARRRNPSGLSKARLGAGRLETSSGSSRVTPNPSASDSNEMWAHRRPSQKVSYRRGARVHAIRTD